MNLVYGLALHEFSVAQWIECSPAVCEVIGSNPVGDSDFFLCPTLVTVDYFIFTVIKLLLLLLLLSFEYDSNFSVVNDQGGDL